MLRWLGRLLLLPTLAWNRAATRISARRQWITQLESGLWFGGLPNVHEAAQLARWGVRHVVNLCDEAQGPTTAYRQAGITQHHLRSPDFVAPSLTIVEHAVQLVEQSRRAGGVYVHCKVGKNRSPTVMICWLIAAHGLTPAEAERRVESARPCVFRHLARRPVVRQFAARHRPADKGHSA